MNLTLVFKVHILLTTASHMVTSNGKGAGKWNLTIYQKEEKQKCFVNMTEDLPQLRGKKRMDVGIGSSLCHKRDVLCVYNVLL